MASRKKKQPVSKRTKSSLGYAGTVTVSIAAGSKTLSKRTYHNNGSARLFDFLARCIVGDYAAIDGVRPTMIAAYSLKDDSTTPADVRQAMVSGGFASNLLKEATIAKIGISQRGTTDAEEHAGELHFRIPYSALTESSICAFCLFDKSGADSDGNWDAYYLLTDENGAWDPLVVSSAKNYNILIKWSMKIDNQNETQEAN